MVLEMVQICHYKQINICSSLLLLIFKYDPILHVQISTLEKKFSSAHDIDSAKSCSIKMFDRSNSISLGRVRLGIKGDVPVRVIGITINNWEVLFDDIKQCACINCREK